MPSVLESVGGEMVASANETLVSDPLTDSDVIGDHSRRPLEVLVLEVTHPVQIGPNFMKTFH